jgi:hypothetical protein
LEGVNVGRGVAVLDGVKDMRTRVGRGVGVDVAVLVGVNEGANTLVGVRRTSGG